VNDSIKSSFSTGPAEKRRASRNRTLTISEAEAAGLEKRLLRVMAPLSIGAIENRTICGDSTAVAAFLPRGFADLLFLDPPYNLNKSFNGHAFRELPSAEYRALFESWLAKFVPLLKPTASVYICGDWRSSGAIQAGAEKHLHVRNRITWEREKGRGAKSNWKNCAEDIWFCTVSEEFFFNAEAVKVKRRVIAPYTDDAGQPKDWERTEGGDFRLTSPSNLWTDITVPFWSMPENTDHPTQKPEKLLAKIILASTQEGGLVFDPFLGSGTTSVVAKKLGRRFVGIEQDLTYCALAEKRLCLADADKTIQGYSHGIFWERNSDPHASGRTTGRGPDDSPRLALFASRHDA